MTECVIHLSSVYFFRLQEKDVLNLDILAAEVCARISSQDLLRMCDVGDSNPADLSPSEKRKSKISGLIVDIRSAEEYPLAVVTVGLGWFGDKERKGS